MTDTVRYFKHDVHGWIYRLTGPSDWALWSPATGTWVKPSDPKALTHDLQTGGDLTPVTISEVAEAAGAAAATA